MYPLQAKMGDIPPVRFLFYNEVRKFSWEIKKQRDKKLISLL